MNYKCTQMLIRVESEKQQGLSYINKKAFEWGYISGEKYLEEERRIMEEAVKNIKKIMDDALGL